MRTPDTGKIEAVDDRDQDVREAKSLLRRVIEGHGEHADASMCLARVLAGEGGVVIATFFFHSFPSHSRSTLGSAAVQISRRFSIFLCRERDKNSYENDSTTFAAAATAAFVNFVRQNQSSVVGHDPHMLSDHGMSVTLPHQSMNKSACALYPLSDYVQQPIDH